MFWKRVQAPPKARWKLQGLLRGRNPTHQHHHPPTCLSERPPRTSNPTLYQVLFFKCSSFYDPLNRKRVKGGEIKMYIQTLLHVVKCRLQPRGNRLTTDVNKRGTG